MLACQLFLWYNQYDKSHGSDKMLSIYLSALDTQEEKDFFEDMYRNNRGKMLSIAYSILGNKEDAEDAVHIAFLKLADQLKNLLQKSRQDLKRYIVITIRNTSITIYNRNKKNAQRLEALNDDTPDNVFKFEASQIEALQIALPKLPQNYKDILTMYYYMRMSAGEISKTLDISVDNVWKRLSRARNMLKALIEESETDE